MRQIAHMQTIVQFRNSTAFDVWWERSALCFPLKCKSIAVSDAGKRVTQLGSYSPYIPRQDVGKTHTIPDTTVFTGSGSGLIMTDALNEND